MVVCEFVLGMFEIVYLDVYLGFVIGVAVG